MGFRNVFGVAAGLVASTVGLSISAFAAAGDFNFMTTLSQGAGSTTSISGSQINTTDTANYVNYTNGSDSGQIDNGAGAGTAIVLQSYSTTATDLTQATVASNYTDLISFTDLTTGQTQTKTLTGSYGGGIGSNNTHLTQTFNQTSLTFLFADGTYVVNGFGEVSPGPPGATAPGSTGASVSFSTAGAAPEPSALMLVVPGVIGMVGFARRRKSSK